MTLAVATLVRNEADRFLPSMLSAWSDFADQIILLDDGSTDGTRELIQGYPKVRYHLRCSSEGMWGQESPARQLLFHLAQRSTADWLLWLDADMVPACDPRSLLVPEADAVAFRLFDLWDPTHYRSDARWRAHDHPRIWAIKNPGPDFVGEWDLRGIHCGHLPANIPTTRVMVATLEYSILHYAYSSPELRSQKLDQYLSKADLLSPSELDHARSITDPNPTLLKLPISTTWPIHFAS